MAIAGVGAKFRRWNILTGVWDSIAQINSITGPGMTRETIDTTSLDTTGGYRTFIGGFRDGGQVSLAMNFTRTAWEQMKDDYESDVEQNYEIILPDTENTTVEFSGIVLECPLSIPPDDKVTSDVTIKVSGAVVVNSGSGS